MPRDLGRAGVGRALGMVRAVTGAETAWTREAAHNRRREARPGYAPTRTRRIGWALLAAGEGHLIAAAVEHLMAPARREEDRNEGHR